MTARDVAIVATGIANVRSVVAGFERAGARVVTTDRPEVVRDAARVVLPGVGSFGTGIDMLREHELDVALAERLAADRPLLAICLGLQLLAQGSDESPDAVGLGAFDARARRFTGDVRVPQIGWNRVEGLGAEPQWFYFAHSYRLTDAPTGVDAAWAEHGGHFVAAFERGAVLACQFHPELSGDAGLELISKWLEGGRACSQPA